MTFWAIDRIGGAVAILISDSGEEATVALHLLPAGLREGMVLSVAHDSSGEPRWETARPDPEEARRRLERARHFLKEISDADPGTDLEL